MVACKKARLTIQLSYYRLCSADAEPRTLWPSTGRDAGAFFGIRADGKTVRPTVFTALCDKKLFFFAFLASFARHVLFPNIR
jgi:hypothetical protein